MVDLAASGRSAILRPLNERRETAMSEHGQMDIRAHQEMWIFFTRLVTWGIGITAVTLGMMALFLT